jgi:hypothetical protein
MTVPTTLEHLSVFGMLSQLPELLVLGGAHLLAMKPLVE